MWKSMITVLALCLSLNVAIAEEGEASAEKQADIRKLLELTGALDIGKQMSDAFVANMTRTLKINRPDIPPEMYDVLEEEVNRAIGEALPAFAEMIVPVYHKHFTGEEIKGLIAFYSTALGRKTISVMPGLVRDSMALGQQWGRLLAPEVRRRVRERFKSEGVDLAA